MLPFDAPIGYLPGLRERQSTSSSIGKKLSRGFFLVVLHSRGVNLGRRYSTYWGWRIGKFGVIETHFRRMKTKQVLITRRDEECVFPVADGLAKWSGRDYELPEPTLRRESTVRRENLSGESHGDREEFQPEETKDDEGINEEFCAHAEARKEFHSSPSYWTEKFNARAWVKLLWKGITISGEDWWKFRRHHVQIICGLTHWQEFGKANMRTGSRCFKITRAEVSEDTNSLVLILQDKDGILRSITTWYTYSFQWKDLKESFSPDFFFQGESWRKLYCLVTQRICGTKILRVTLQPREFEILSSVSLGRKKFEHRMLICSANLGCTPECGRCTHKQNMDIGKPRVTNGSDNSGDLSFRDACLGKPRSMKKRSFATSNVDSRCKGSSGQGMKGGHKATHKTTKRKVHFVALMGIR